MHVLVCYDSSDSAKAALLSVAARVWPPGSKCRLLHVGRGSENELSKIAQAIDGFSEVSIEFRHGNIYKEILKGAEEFEADLIVIGSRGTVGLTNLVMGNVCQDVLHHARIPVMVGKTPHKGAFKDVIICTDGSKDSALAVQMVQKHAWSKETRFTLVEVTVPKLSEYLPSLHLPIFEDWLLYEKAPPNRIIEGAHELYDCGMALENTFGPNRVERVLAEGLPVEEIIAVSRRIGADLIVLARHHSAHHFMHPGSVSDSLSAMAPCSVEIVV